MGGSFIGSDIGGVYSVLELIGTGGMGTVYRGLHSRLNRPVAIKVLHAAMQDRTHSEQFLAEARLQASLRHPAIATLYDFMEHRGQGCIIMEFVEGPTLADYLQSHGQFAPRKALPILRQLSEAVNYLHKQGIVHRDLKPANIKLTPDGSVKLLDFGIASALRSTNSGNRDRRVVGTFEYMAPECLAGEPADQRSDIWSLGVLFYEMLTGQLPFKGSSVEELRRQMNAGQFPPPSSVNKQVDSRVESFIGRCLNQKPSGRFTDITSLERQIDYLTAGVKATPSFDFNLSVLRRFRIPLIVAAAILAIILVYKLIPSSGGGGENEKTISIETADGPAEVFRDGKDLGTTPVRIEAPMGTHVELLLKREGYADQPESFDVTERSAYSYVMHEAPAGH